MHRAIQESEISDKPPHFRETWNYLLLNAAWKDGTIKGRKVKRGELYTSYSEIINALEWHVGNRPGRYKHYEIQMAIRYFKKATMITTAKTISGFKVTVLNYDKYQDPEHRETHGESHSETHTQDLHLYIEKRKKEGIEFPEKFPIQKFVQWESARRSNPKARKMTAKNRKSALTSLGHAINNPEAAKAMGYNSLGDILDDAIDSQWAGFTWLKRELEKKNNMLSRIQKNRAGEPARKLPTFEETMRDQQ